MKNTSILIAVVLVFIIGGLGVSAFNNRDVSMTSTDSMEETEAIPDDDESVNVYDDEAGDVIMKKEAKYTSFSTEVFTDSATNRRVLFFYANWCPTCKPADASFSENVAKIPADVTLFRVNYNDTETDQGEKDLARKYGVTYQHTFVQIDAKGNEVAKWNGGKIEELLANLK